MNVDRQMLITAERDGYLWVASEARAGMFQALLANALLQNIIRPDLVVTV